MGSQCGLLGVQQPGLQTQLGHVLAVWPWADPLTSLGLIQSSGFLGGQNKNVRHVWQSTDKEKTLFLERN